MRFTWDIVSLALAVGVLFASPVAAKAGVCAAHSQVCVAHSQVCHFDDGSWKACHKNTKCSYDGATCEEIRYWARRDEPEVTSDVVQHRDRP